MTAPARDPHALSIAHLEALGEPRMHLDARLRVLVDERSDAARLRAGEELRHDAAGRENDRKLCVDVLRRRTVLDRVEAGLAVGVVKPPALAHAPPSR